MLDFLRNNAHLYFDRLFSERERAYLVRDMFKKLLETENRGNLTLKRLVEELLISEDFVDLKHLQYFLLLKEDLFFFSEEEIEKLRFSFEPETHIKKEICKFLFYNYDRITEEGLTEEIARELVENLEPYLSKIDADHFGTIYTETLQLF